MSELTGCDSPLQGECRRFDPVSTHQENVVKPRAWIAPGPLFAALKHDYRRQLPLTKHLMPTGGIAIKAILGRTVEQSWHRSGSAGHRGNLSSNGQERSPSPLTPTFRDEAEGDAYCARLEALLDRGIVPTEYRPTNAVTTITDLIDRYARDHAVPSKDLEVLRTISKSVGSRPLAIIDAAWADAWISDMKRIHKLAPATIRSKVGALARCTDWGVRKKLLLLPDHPLRTLPEGYATYLFARYAGTSST